MAFVTQTIPASARAEGAFSDMFARFKQYRDYRATVKALSALSDAELADIGMTRGEIRDAAANAAK